MDSELTYRECLDVLTAECVGRVAFCTPRGPEIVPLNYRVVDDAVVFRTTPYSVLGSHGRDARMVLEVDRLSAAAKAGTSVVAHGRCLPVSSTGERELIRLFHDPDPWADGPRWLYLKLVWTSLTGRRIGGTSGTTWLLDARA
jgi:nitroimidazol reductase NimA-like FMN-containing flavoprotein (pyridoxamine 5'-phosphate oxidase superfamily)